MVVEKRNSQVLVNLPATCVPRCIGSNAKHLQLPKVATSSEPLDGTHVVRHGTYEMLVEQDFLSGGLT